MRTSLQKAAAGALLALAAGIGAAHADAGPSAHRYSIYGSLDVAAAEKTTASEPTSLKGRLSAPAQDIGLQAGGDFVVMAKLAESPQGCSGGDTIFTNGFEG